MKALILSLAICLSCLFAQAQTADELFTSKEYVKAIDAYTTVLKAEPENVQALRRLAFCYLNTDNTEMLASMYFEKALKLDPKDAASNYYLGMMSKDALSKQLTAAQRHSLITKAKQYLSAAAELGDADAKKELSTLK